MKKYKYGENIIPTTVKLNKDIYDDFKILCIKNKTKLNLQVFINKCINLYTTNRDFRFIVNNYNISLISEPTKKVNLNPVIKPVIEPMPEPTQQVIQQSEQIQTPVLTNTSEQTIILHQDSSSALNQSQDKADFPLNITPSSEIPPVTPT